jgi:hypothetical protein
MSMFSGTLVSMWCRNRKKMFSKYANFFLPCYRPELNPGEMLNQNVKDYAMGANQPAIKKKCLIDFEVSSIDANAVRYAAEKAINLIS